MGSFWRIFENGMKGRNAELRGSDRTPVGSAVSDASLFMTPTNIRGLSVRGTIALLVCNEEVLAKGAGRNGGTGHQDKRRYYRQ